MDLTIKLKLLGFKEEYQGFWLQCQTFYYRNSNGRVDNEIKYFYSYNSAAYYHEIDDSGECIGAHRVIKAFGTWRTETLLSWLSRWHCQEWSLDDGCFNDADTYFELHTFIPQKGGLGSKEESFQDSCLQNCLAKAVIYFIQQESLNL